MFLGVAVTAAAFAGPIPSWRNFRRRRRVKQIARALIASTTPKLEQPGTGSQPPVFRFDFTDTLNIDIGLAAYTEGLARKDKILRSSVEETVERTEERFEEAKARSRSA